MNIRTIVLPLVAAISAGTLCSPAMASESAGATPNYSVAVDLESDAQSKLGKAAAASSMFTTRSGEIVVNEDEKARIEKAMASPEWASQAPGVSIKFTEVAAADVVPPLDAEGEVGALAIVKDRWFGFEVILSRSETATLGDSYAACNSGIGTVTTAIGLGIGGPTGAAIGAAVAALGCATIWVGAKHAVNSGRCLKFKVTKPVLPGPINWLAVMHPGTCVQD